AGNTNGAFAIDPATGALTVAAALDYETQSSYVLTIEVSDGALSGTGTVTVNVTDVVGGPGVENMAPVAIDDAIQLEPLGTATTLTGGAASVLWNDLDPDAGETASLTVTMAVAPTAGTLTLNPDGTFLYANTVDAGADSFEYEVCDAHAACNVGIVSITITTGAQNRLPAVVDDAMQVAPLGTQTILTGDLASVLQNDFDPDGDALSAKLLVAPTAGMVVLATDGTFSYTHTVAMATSDAFWYQACDVHGACMPGRVSIVIGADVINQLPLAMNDTTVTLAPGGTADTLADGETSVLANDSDPDEGETATLTATLISQPSKGEVALNQNGTFSYTHDIAASVGDDSFWYEACDIHGACSAAKVSITITADAPEVSCQLDPQIHTVGDAVDLDLSRLFVAPNGQALAYSIAGLPASLSVDPTTGWLSGVLGEGDASLTPYTAIFIATTVPDGVSASESVSFAVFPEGEVVFRDGFDLPPQHCQ
ncbi:Ig-like domain-containing protein, partial [Dokdonella fugitiva]